MALLVLELSVVGVLGTLTLANRTLRRAEQLERAATRVEALLDSIRGAPPVTASAVPDSGFSASGDVRVHWWLDSGGDVRVVATDLAGGQLVRVRARVGVR